MIDLNIKDYMARTTKNRMTLAETLDRMRRLYKSISFESKVIRGEYNDLFDDDMKTLCHESVQYAFGELYYCQRCIDYGNYMEENRYVSKVS